LSNPSWLNGIFAGLMLMVAAYSVGRLVAARAWSRPIHRDVDVAHVFMGMAMAGMLVADLNPIPSGVWEFVFSALAVWFVWRCYQFLVNRGGETHYHEHVHRLSRRVIHLVMSLAMLYMYMAMVPSEARSGGSMAMGAATGTTANFVLLPALFVLALAVSAIWQLDAIGRFSSSARPIRPSPAFSTVGGSPNSSEGERASEVPIDGPAFDGNVEAPAWLAPRLEAGSHIVMCVAMAYMLILML
jgi:hypothetical protein